VIIRNLLFINRSPRPFDTKSIIKTLNQILRLQLIKEQSISVIYQKSGARRLQATNFVVAPRRFSRDRKLALPFQSKLPA